MKMKKQQKKLQKLKRKKENTIKSRQIVQHLARGTHGRCIRLLDMPLVQTGQPHGNALAAEHHPAFQFHFPTHVVSPCARQGSRKLPDHPSVYPGTDQYFRTIGAVTLCQQAAQNVNTLHTAGGGTAGQHGINSKGGGVAVGLQWVGRYINGAVPGLTVL